MSEGIKKKIILIIFFLALVSAGIYFILDQKPDTNYNDSRTKKYSPDKNYAVEIVSEEPDTLVYLWDIRENKSSQIAACGTPCTFNTLDWLDNKRVILWGVETDELGKSAKFIKLINIENGFTEWYSNK